MAKYTPAHLLHLLLKEIESSIQQVEQWSKHLYADGFAENTLKYMNHLEAYVEVLEIYDCDSTGGFGAGESHQLDLLGRAKWLLKKYRHAP